MCVVSPSLGNLQNRIGMSALSDDGLIELWRTSENMEERDRIVEEMKKRKLFPQKDTNEIESSSGLYPATDDPLFLQKLLRKQEFAENKQMSISEARRKGDDPCKSSSGAGEFELSPTQRFIGQYLSPKTPYMSALLFHGVGVGKTCSAITVAERYLEMFPRKQVIIIAPRNIQPNFSREIFTETKLKIGEDDEPNQYFGCTGDTYLKLSGTEFIREKSVVVNRINSLKARRYQFVGYLAFYNYLKDLLEREISKDIRGKRREQEEYKLLNKKFSNRLLIIDEAHNVRDLTEEEEGRDAPGGAVELSESQAGKRLTPYLRKLLAAAEGTKLLLLSATPMYNSYKEIIPMLNLLLLNDKKATVSEGDFFDAEGKILEGKEKELGSIMQVYVSFMRGENPLTFPLRLEPQGLPRVTVWPTKNPVGETIQTGVNTHVREQIVELPFVPSEYTETGLNDYRAIVTKLILASGLRLGATDGLVQAGNFIFPAAEGVTPEGRIREQGFKNTFTETKEPRQYKMNAGIPRDWIHESNLPNYSPKCATILQRLRTTEGISFIYSRFVYSGALSIALILEANGYENAGRASGYLKDATPAPGGKQCALCPRKYHEHTGVSGHTFKQAKYVLLTGRDDLTPNNKGSIELATSSENSDGSLVKVIIGSQVASEGIDLKCIREVLVFDSWYHLNKLEQVIGRGIRFCSHAALPEEKRNCTVILLLTTFPASQGQETIDMFQYRAGFEKAYQIGKITLLMKEYAIDCNLNHDSVVISGLDDVDVVDSQRQRYKHSINDTPFTNMCDWIEDCDYKCGVQVEIKPSEIDDSTYDEYAARWRVHQVKERLRKLFMLQPSYSIDQIIHNLADIPRIAIASILSEVVDNRLFRIQVNGETGYIVHRNKYYLFQPHKIPDTRIPIALRAALFPVKQDSYEDFEPLRKTAVEDVVAVAVARPASATTAVEPQVDDTSLITFWDIMMKFVESIKAGTVEAARSQKKILPDEVENVIRNRYIGNKKAEDKAYNIISMIYRFYTSIQGTADWREALAYAAAKFLWDEVLTIEEQYTIYEKKKENPSVILSMTWDEHLISFDNTIVYRRVNPLTGTLEYKCNGATCSYALVNEIEQEDESTDELRSLRANKNTTGTPYGTMNYKDGIFVFKTNEPVEPSRNPAEREKQDRGSECANVANMVPHYMLLEQLGRIAESFLGTNLDFVIPTPTEPQSQASTPICYKIETGLCSVKNSVRACALTDIALRFFDELGFDGKRWFYRPLPTFYTKHPGILRKKAV